MRQNLLVGGSQATQKCNENGEISLADRVVGVLLRESCLIYAWQCDTNAGHSEPVNRICYNPAAVVVWPERAPRGDSAEAS